jgi:hypothetical protein
MCDCSEKVPKLQPHSGVRWHRDILDEFSAWVRIARDWEVGLRTQVAKAALCAKIGSSAVNYQCHSPWACIEADCDAESHRVLVLGRWNGTGVGFLLSDLDFMPVLSLCHRDTRLRVAPGIRGFCEASAIVRGVLTSITVEGRPHRRLTAQANCRLTRVSAECTSTGLACQVDHKVLEWSSIRLWLGSDFGGIGSRVTLHQNCVADLGVLFLAWRQPKLILSINIESPS